MTTATITITTIRAAIKWRQYFLDGNSKIRNIQIQKKTTDKWNFRFGNVQKPTATITTTKRETDKQTTLLSCLHSRDFTDNKTMKRNNKIWNRKKSIFHLHSISVANFYAVHQIWQHLETIKILKKNIFIIIFYNHH